MKKSADSIKEDGAKFELFFRAVSYASVLCGFSALWVSGSIGVTATVLFVLGMIAAWVIEDSRWQIGEKLGTSLIVLALPIFYGVWQVSSPGDGIWIAGLLARMILCLTVVKLLQRKSDRDWIFLYLMAFFEVLLAAGLSISGIYLINFLAYLLLMACAIIAFEIRKTSRKVGRELAAFQDRKSSAAKRDAIRVARIPGAALTIILLTVLLAIPLFFVLPRVGGAGLGSSQRELTTSGFSDKVTLGRFGRITEDDRVVMRVKFDDLPALSNNLYFRGLALDTFDSRSWSRSSLDAKAKRPRPSDDTIIVSDDRLHGNRVAQTIYLEPIEKPVLFALPMPVEVRGGFDAIGVDAAGAIQHTRPNERISYRVVSDTSVPGSKELREDHSPYTTESVIYRTLPEALDPRIPELAEKLTSRFDNRYDKAREVEHYLQSEFGYTLEQKASGPDPLADFLFRAKEGHCEYFASAMAVLLRTQGIATRVVTGFHGGDYNETAGMVIVRQRHAHAWVEVYFPGEDVWVTFDPTPVGGQPGDAGNANGVVGAFASYAEALEAMWIEYFVAFDDHGQEGLKTSVVSEFAKFQNTFTAALGVAHQLTGEWLSDVRGEGGTTRAFTSAVYVIAGIIVSGAILCAIYYLSGGMINSGLLKRLRSWLSRGRRSRSIEFYEQLLAILEARGIRRSSSQTPLEFALATNLPEALAITEKYQEVRFGARELSEAENEAMSDMIRRLRNRR